MFSLHNGMAEAEAFFAVLLPQSAMERMSRFDFVQEAGMPASMGWFPVTTWWVPMPGGTGSGWKWRNRRWTPAANWAVRQAELLVIWGVVLFRPETLGPEAAMCPLDGRWRVEAAAAGGAAGGAAAPLLGSEEGAAPPAAAEAAGGAALLQRFWSCGGCCRGLVVFAEGGVSALCLFVVSAFTAAHLFKRQYCYLDSLSDDDAGPGRGACGIRDPATGAPCAASARSAARSSSATAALASTRCRSWGTARACARSLRGWCGGGAGVLGRRRSERRFPRARGGRCARHREERRRCRRG